MFSIERRTMTRAETIRDGLKVMKMAEKKSKIRVETFESLVAPHLQPLYGFALRRTRSQADAEDLVQDTLLRGWDRIDSLHDPERVRPWLFTILVNLHNERARKQARRRRIMPMSDLEDTFDDRIVSPLGSPLDEVIRHDAIEAVRKALRQVPDLYAMAVELRDFEGLSYKEIARVLDIPEGTVMSRVGRGRKHLARLLSEWRDAPSSSTKAA